MSEKSRESGWTADHSRARIQSMKAMIQSINKSEEIEANGFSYPEAWLESFRQELERCLKTEEAIRPGLVTYGSLRNPFALEALMANQNKNQGIWTPEKKKPYEVVRMEGIRRGLWYSGATRELDSWRNGSLGIDSFGENGVMAVRADESGVMDGLRIEWSAVESMKGALLEREFAYTPVPGPPALGVNGAEHKLNLVLWPLGRTLINSIPQRQEILKAKTERLGMRQGNYPVVQVRQDPHFVKEGLSDPYRTRISRFYSLEVSHRPRPSLPYLESCLASGVPGLMSDEEFLVTTYCYGPDGQEIPLADYLEGGIPYSRKVRRGGWAKIRK